MTVLPTATARPRPPSLTPCTQRAPPPLLRAHMLPRAACVLLLLLLLLLLVLLLLLLLLLLRAGGCCGCCGCGCGCHLLPPHCCCYRCYTAASAGAVHEHGISLGDGYSPFAKHWQMCHASPADPISTASPARARSS